MNQTKAVQKRKYTRTIHSRVLAKGRKAEKFVNKHVPLLILIAFTMVAVALAVVL